VNLVLLEPGELERSEVGASMRVRLSDHRAQHLREVLGVELGSSVRVGIVDGGAGVATVVALASEAVVLELGELGPTPPSPRLDLLLCLPRPKVLARLFSPLAQLGVGSLYLSGAYRVERFYFDAHVLRPEEHRLLLLEGLAQARDTRLPEVSVHRSFAWLVRTELGPPSPDVLRLYADPGAPRGLRAAIGEWPARATGRILIAIGPEGGFTDRERRELEAAEFAPVGMGARTLRTDVATIALLALAHEALDGR
jgi:RsmE family RNA methyltransferase